MRPPKMLRHFVRGALIGIAEAVPGVSGGTVALVVGIYDRLIASISATARAAANVVRGRTDAAREAAGGIDLQLLAPLLAGMAPALLAALWFIAPLLERNPVTTNAVFFGLIAGSLAVPWRRLGRRTLSLVGVAAAAGVVAFLLAGLPQRVVADPAAALVFAAAAVAICALVLPGVSGAYLLAAFGVYVPVADAVRAGDMGIAVVFSAGAVTGLALFSRPLDYLLARHHDVTMATLLGLMAGGLRALWPWQTDDRALLPPPGDLSAVAVLVTAAVAFAAVRLLIVAGDRVGAPASSSS